MLSFTILCFFFSFVQAIPTLLSRDVFDPPITTPTASTVWQVGQTVTVTWDTTNLPPPSQLTDPNGMVVLGFMANASDSEHLMLNPPLAQNFPLSDGNVSFVVPSVVTRTDYIVVLFGDSGNISPTFTIQGTDASSSASGSTSSSSSSAAATSDTDSVSPTTVVSSSSGAATASSSSEASVTNTLTSVITASTSVSAPSVSGTATTPTVASPSSAAGSSSSASSSGATTSPQAANTNAAWKVSSRHNQVYAFIVAGLVAACLL